jgi:hypothetical protein
LLQTILKLRCTAPHEEVRNKRDDGEYEKNVNKETADVEEKETACPAENQNERQKKKHEPPPYLKRDERQSAWYRQ